MFPSIEKIYSYTSKANSVAYLMAGSSDQLKEALEITQADKQEAKRLRAAGERVLTRVREDKNKLQDSNTLLGEELKDV